MIQIQNRKHGATILIKDIKSIYENRTLYLMALPAAVLLFLFCYMPLFGLLIAFKDFQFGRGILHSAWIKPIYYNFQYLFDSDAAFRAIRNTILLNAMFIGSGVLFEVGFAVVMNEIGNVWFKKIAQSVTFLPFFMSWIIVGVFSYNMLNSEHGVVNNVLSSFGFQKVDWYSNAGVWPLILMIVARWKNTGYGAVIYLASLANLDPSYYEAAKIDGATKWQQIKYISLPMLRPTIIILVLLQIGKIMNADFGMFYAIVGDDSMVFPTTDVIDTFVYRGLRLMGDVGMSSAAGFMQSVVSFILVIASNLVVRKYEEGSALF